MKAWFDRLPLPWRRWRVTDVVDSMADVPARLPHRGAVLVIFANVTPGWLAFDCPCSRGHRVMLNLDRARYPAWSLLDLNPLTIVPSVHDASGPTECHYFIRGGRVMWARNLGDHRKDD